uniref:Uncharacterized protein n=1 Tax=Glossina austeni TaxID=7395 RepID=A0A1A9UL06_GLOAU
MATFLFLGTVYKSTTHCQLVASEFGPVFLIALLSVIVATEDDESPSAQPITFSFLASPSSSFSFFLFFFLSICACNLSLEAICTRWLSSSDTSILETDRQELY